MFFNASKIVPGMLEVEMPLKMMIDRDDIRFLASRLRCRLRYFLYKITLACLSHWPTNNDNTNYSSATSFVVIIRLLAHFAHSPLTELPHYYI